VTGDDGTMHPADPSCAYQSKFQHCQSLSIIFF